MAKLTILPTIEFKTSEAFETWLVKNHDNSTGLWLKIFKKDSGIKTISYAEALDVALCYGWIDGQKKHMTSKPIYKNFVREEKKVYGLK